MSPDKAAKALTTINRNAESLQQLLDDLLDTGQLVAGRMRLAIDVVDLGSVVREAIEAVRLSADNKGVILASKVQTGPQLMTRGDGVRLKQVVWNLLANGIKFTPRGGEVIVAVTSLGQGVRLEVLTPARGSIRGSCRMYSIGSARRRHQQGPNEGSASALRLPVTSWSCTAGPSAPTAMVRGRARRLSSSCRRYLNRRPWPGQRGPRSVTPDGHASLSSLTIVRPVGGAMPRECHRYGHNTESSCGIQFRCQCVIASYMWRPRSLWTSVVGWTESQKRYPGAGR